VSTRPLLTVKQVCAQLAIGRTQLNGLFRAGTLTKIALGPKSIRVDPDDLDRYIDRSRLVTQKVRDSVARAFDADQQFDQTDNPFR
jgi:excisionase family DNA binding protein